MDTQLIENMGMAPYVIILFIAVLIMAVRDLINPDNVKQEIAALVKLGQDNVEHILEEYSIVTTVLKICFAAGWLLTVNYAVSYFSGADIRTIANWSINEWSGAFIGLCVTTAITAVQYVLYSSGNHRGAAVFVTAAILSFVVYSEVSSPMEKEDLKMRTRSVDSPLFQSLTEGIKQGQQNGSSAYAMPLAEAQAELAKDQQMLSTCAKRYSTTKSINRCKDNNQREIAQDKARIESLQQQQQLESQNNQASTNAMMNQAKAMEANEDNHSAIIKFLMTILGTNMAILANALSAFIVVVAFEVAFHFVGSRRGILKSALIELGCEDIKLIQKAKRAKHQAKYHKKAERYQQGANNPIPSLSITTSNFMSRFKQNASAGHPSPALKTVADSIGNEKPAAPQPPTPPQTKAKKPQFKENKKLMGITKHAHFVKVTTGILDGSLPSQNQITKLDGVSSHPARAMIDLLYALDYVEKNQNGTFSLSEDAMPTEAARKTATYLQDLVKNELTKLEKTQGND